VSKIIILNAKIDGSGQILAPPLRLAGAFLAL
jgi:hypothetical protein